MKRSAVLLAIIAAAPVGCSMLDPYPTAPAPPEPKVVDAGPRVAICYDTLRSSLDQVRTAAQAECSAGTTATPVDTDLYMQNCPLLLPARATFICAPHK